MAQSPPLPAPNLSASQLEQLLERLREHLPAELFTEVQHLLRVLCWVLQVLAEKKIGLQRLPDLLFRSRNEQASKIFAPAPADSETLPSLPRRARKGHGRRKSAEYLGADVNVKTWGNFHERGETALRSVLKSEVMQWFYRAAVGRNRLCASL